jgi:hypothetical protein
MQEPFAQLIERTLSGAERTVLYRLIRSPRHVRHFASDPIPTDPLQRILDDAWYGQSVGGRAPGQVFLITSPALHTKITSVVHASHAGDASRLSHHRSPRASWSLTSERTAEAPLHLSVTCDCWRGDARGLDLAPVPETAIFGAVLTRSSTMMCGESYASSSLLPGLLAMIMTTCNIRDRSGGRQSLTCGSRAKRIGRESVPRRRLKCGIALSP